MARYAMNVLDCDTNQGILVVKCMLHKKIGDLKFGYDKPTR